ncbi:hypothetical protein ADK55_03350 [Streptomyces sp. WM4235]|nr:hypothetical protein ADK55_03350 [Streptomyces sp. WM4235]
MILMADGTTKKIEDVEVGDEVLATDTETGETSPKIVTAEIFTENDKDFADLSISTDDTVSYVTTTTHHPFWSDTENTWIYAGQLESGTTLRTTEGHKARLVDSHLYKAKQATYNLTVADSHTYYVLAGATPVLVHNDDPLPTQLKGRNQPLTSKQATDLAKYLGYRDEGTRLKGQKIFTNGKTFISQDIGNGDGSHNGGTWKIAKSVKALGSKSSRTATTDALLNPIGC